VKKITKLDVIGNGNWGPEQMADIVAQAAPQHSAITLQQEPGLQVPYRFRVKHDATLAACSLLILYMVERNRPTSITRLILRLTRVPREEQAYATPYRRSISLSSRHRALETNSKRPGCVWVFKVQKGPSPQSARQALTNLSSYWRWVGSPCPQSQGVSVQFESLPTGRAYNFHLIRRNTESCPESPCAVMTS
jgi:hypothetical protein